MKLSSCYGAMELGFEKCALPETTVRVGDCNACDVCFGALRKMAFEDPLTGLPNRRALQREYHEAKHAGIQVAAATIDLERFKFVNSTLGHDVGDQFLRRTAELLQQSTREEAYVTRQGGDEFTLLVKFIDRDGRSVINLNTGTILQSISDRISTNFHRDRVFKMYNDFVEDDKRLGVRIGYALPDDKYDLVRLIAEADTKGVDQESNPDPEDAALSAIMQDMLSVEPVNVWQ